jgi:hypothetical protein
MDNPPVYVTTRPEPYVVEAGDGTTIAVEDMELGIPIPPVD